MRETGQRRDRVRIGHSLDVKDEKRPVLHDSAVHG
jgi:hypothetical protein